MSRLKAITDFSNTDASSNPYDRKISDHKRKITTQIKKAVKGKAAYIEDDINDLIRTKRNVGFMLNLKGEEVWVLGCV